MHEPFRIYVWDNGLFRNCKKSEVHQKIVWHVSIFQNYDEEKNCQSFDFPKFFDHLRCSFLTSDFMDWRFFPLLVTLGCFMLRSVTSDSLWWNKVRNSFWKNVRSEFSNFFLLRLFDFSTSEWSFHYISYQFFVSFDVIDGSPKSSFPG